jgi:hypothetical protein
MYGLARQLNKENNDLLWLWILGLSEQLVYNKITPLQYESFVDECQKEVLRFNNQSERGGKQPMDIISTEQGELLQIDTIHKPIGTISIESE